MIDRRAFLALVGRFATAAQAVEAQQSAHIAVLFNSSLQAQVPQVEAFRLGLRDYGWIEGENMRVEYRSAEGRADRVRALAHRRVLIRLAASYRLPAFYEFKDYVTDGGLISYGPSLPEMYRRAAYYVDRILKGAKPAEIPIERPSRFELIINLKTARALGLTIPSSVLLRADQVIE